MPGREDCDARVVVFLVVVPEMWEPYCDPVTVPWVNGGAVPSTSNNRSTALSKAVCASTFEALCATSHSATSQGVTTEGSTKEGGTKEDYREECKEGTSGPSTSDLR